MIVFRNFIRECIAIVMLLAVVACGSSGDADIENSDSEIVFNGTSKQLNPSFSSDILRYSLIAEPDSQPLSLITNFGEYSTVTVEGVLAGNNVELDMQDIEVGQTIDISVIDSDGQTRAYEVLYLPADFPELKVTVLTDDVAPGDIYLALKQRNTEYEENYITILDNNGVPKFYRKTEGPTNNFRRHVTGEYSYSLRLVDAEDSDTGRKPFDHVILNSDFVEIERLRAVGMQNTDFHAFRIKENGNPVFLSYEPSIRDLTPYGGLVDSFVEDSIIQEVDRSTGQVLSQWNSWGYIKYEDELRGAEFDYAHVNAIDIDLDGNIIVTARGTSQISKIEWSTGELLWTFGGKSNQFTFVDDPFSNLCGPHTATILDNGNILMFDNGQYCWPENATRGEQTRVTEYALDLINMTATLVWSYNQLDSYSLSGRSAQRLPNGNTLIGWNRGSNILSTEVDGEGNKVFELEATYDGEPINSYRAYRFD